MKPVGMRPDLYLTEHFSIAKKYSFIAISLLLIIVSLYGNSLHNSWHFDDYNNIVNNPNIKLDRLTWDGLKIALQGIPGESIPRPLSYLTFALNYYWGGLDVYGFHIVNILIHYLAAIGLFFLLHEILNLPLIRGKYPGNAYDIALLSSVLWAIHPVQVTGVTYLVQRMTSLCALFYVVAMLFYVKARTAGKMSRVVLYGIVCLIAAILALVSKENAAMLPVSLFLMDLCFIRGVRWAHLKKYLLLFLFPLAVLVIIGAHFTSLAAILDGYRHRPFTLEERLLTEPRVIFFYISQLLYPAIDRLTLLHDIDISTNLLQPWTTLVAVPSVFGVIALSLCLAKKKPIIAFCILFFFLNHLIEGSIIPLELGFEHRNYLPSMFFFMPFVMGLLYLFERFSKKPVMRDTILIVSAVALILLGTTVIARNGIFRDELSLWSDNVEKSPHLQRPHHNLGIVYLSLGRLEEGRNELLKALNARDISGRYNKSHTWFYLGQYYRMAGADDEAMKCFLKALDMAPFYAEPYHAMAEIFLKRNDLDSAEHHVGQALARKQHNGAYHLTYAVILLHKEWPDAAIAEARRAIQFKGDAANAYSLIARSYELKQDANSAILYKAMADGEKRMAH